MIRDLSEIFRINLVSSLLAEGLNKNQLSSVMEEYNEIHYGNSKSKRVLGNLNDLAFHYQLCITESGGVHSPEIPAIIQKLNRMPMKKVKEYIWPIKELRNLIQIKP